MSIADELQRLLFLAQIARGHSLSLAVDIENCVSRLRNSLYKTMDNQYQEAIRSSEVE